MQHRRFVVSLIGLIYLVSFVLPVGPMNAPGYWLFYSSLVMGLIAGCPALLIAWSANILFLLGLKNLFNGQDRRALAYSVAALGASLPAFPMAIPVPGIKPFLDEPGGLGLLYKLAYFAWMLAFISLAAVTVEPMARRLAGDIQSLARIQWLMIVIAGVAVVLAGWPVVVPVLYRNWL